MKKPRHGRRPKPRAKKPRVVRTPTAPKPALYAFSPEVVALLEEDRQAELLGPFLRIQEEGRGPKP